MGEGLKILSAAGVRAIEERVIAGGVSAESLMERAGKGAAERIAREFPRAREALFLIGKGNNGGDGLVVARWLARAGWRVSLSLLAPRAELGPLCGAKLAELLREFAALPVGVWGSDAPRWPEADGVVVDAVLGIGARGDLKPALAEAVRALNREREARFFRTVAIDGPTGLHQLEEDSEKEPAVARADLTLSIGFGKEAFFREEWGDYVGRIHAVPIFDAAAGEEGPADAGRMLEPASLRALLPRRKPRSYKNRFGRVVVIGGSRGTVGAPLIAATGALRSGAGLVNVAVRSEIFAAASGLAPLEAMVLAAGDGAEFEAVLKGAQAIAIGPGLGTDHDAAELLRRILTETAVPLVVDADGLTLFSRDPSLLEACRDRAVLTPHPGEMKRLAGEFSEAARPATARAFADAHGVAVVLKGTRTVVAAPGRPLYLNTTGNPGLAAGGSGDLLTGIVAGLLGQGLERCDAARLGVWLHGRAADLALRARGCEEGLGPLEVAGFLAAALADLRS